MYTSKEVIKLAEEKGYIMHSSLFKQQARIQMWLRNKHKIRLFVLPSKERYTYFIIYNNENDTLKNHALYPGPGQGEPFSYIDYEEALDAGLIDALKLIK